MGANDAAAIAAIDYLTQPRKGGGQAEAGAEATRPGPEAEAKEMSEETIDSWQRSCVGSNLLLLY